MSKKYLPVGAFQNGGAFCVPGRLKSGASGLRSGDGLRRPGRRRATMGAKRLQSLSSLGQCTIKQIVPKLKRTLYLSHYTCPQMHSPPVHRGQSTSTMAREPSPPLQSTVYTPAWETFNSFIWLQVLVIEEFHNAPTDPDSVRKNIPT